MKSAIKSNILTFTIFLVACALLGKCFFDYIWSVSVDLAHHYALTFRIFEHGYNFPSPDPSLGEMNVYPRYAHALAAFIGLALDSPLLGMQVLVFISFFILWGSIFLLIYTLRGRMFEYGVIAILAFGYVFRSYDIPLFGEELVRNYFFSQFIAQSFLMLLLSICLIFEIKKVQPIVRYGFLGIGVLLVEGAHLIPAIELFGFMSLLILVDFFTSENRRVSRIFLTIVLLGMVLIGMYIHPAFSVMRGISEHNGGLYIRLIPDLQTLLKWCSAVLLCSLMLLFGWIHTYSRDLLNKRLAIKYIAIYGVAVSAICLMQILLLKLGHGSEYACKKYIFGLGTALLLDFVFLPVVFFGKKWSSQSLVSFFPANLKVIFDNAIISIFFLMIGTGLYLDQKKISVSSLLSLENAARDAENLPAPHSKGFDYVVALKSHTAIEPYLITIGVFEAPRDANALAILSGTDTFALPDEVRRIFASLGNEKFDFPKCREAIINEEYVLLSAKCVFSQLNLPASL